MKKTINTQHPTTNKKFGFTLLELLVVIAIIGLLVAMGVASYATAQKKGRDSKRKGDLKGIQNALEQYCSMNNGLYPTGPYPNGIATYISGGVVPVDPKTEANYSATTYDTDGYTICATLEGDGSSFCVSNLQ